MFIQHIRPHGTGHALTKQCNTKLMPAVKSPHGPGTKTWLPHFAGVPGVLAALSLGYASNLFGSITHYGSGQAAVYCTSTPSRV